MSREGTAHWPVTVTTQRLIIRPGEDKDRPAVIRLMTDPTTRLYLGGVVSSASVTALELSPMGLTWGNWVIEHRAACEVIGGVYFDYDRGELELSYALLPEFVGYGYAAETCVSMLRWARENLEDDHVIAVTQTRNKRSVNLLRRLGFETRHGLEEFGTQQLLMQRSLEDELPALPDVFAAEHASAHPDDPDGLPDMR